MHYVSYSFVTDEDPNCFHCYVIAQQFVSSPTYAVAMSLYQINYIESC